MNPDQRRTFCKSGHSRIGFTYSPERPDHRTPIWIMTTKRITSSQNPFFRRLCALHDKARERRKEGLFVAEGFREVGRALQNGFEAESIVFDEGITSTSILEEWQATLPADIPPLNLVSLDNALFGKVAYRSSVPNVVAVLKIKDRSVHEIPISSRPLFLLVDRVEKPGNLGAMLRTADAAGVDAVLVCDPHTDIWNPNVIRASLGAAFSVPLACLSAAEASDFLVKNQVPIAVTSLRASLPFYEVDLTGPVAFVVGTEADGVSAFWEGVASSRIVIPMLGQVDSLNVSTAAAIVLFEAVRQRMGQGKILPVD